MKKIVSVKFEKEKEMSEGRQSSVRLAPSGSGSGDSGSGGSSGSLAIGSGNLHLIPTSYSHENYRWNIGGEALWTGSGRLVFVDGEWVLDTSTLSVRAEIHIDVDGETHTSAEIEYVSMSGKVSLEDKNVVKAGPSVSGTLRTTVEGKAKRIDTGTEISDYGYSHPLVFNVSFVVVPSGSNGLDADMGTISYS